MSVTTKGKRWELLHSLWIGWTFTLGFFNWIAFLYIGVRVHRKRWLLWGVFYSLPFVFALSLPDLDGWPGDLVVALTFIMGAAGIVHAFLIRKDYLSRLATRQDDRESYRRLLQENRSGQRVQPSVASSEDQEQPYVFNESYDHNAALEVKVSQPSPSKEDSLIPSEKLSQICIKHVADGYYVGEKLPAKKLSNAREHFPIPETERVVALIDSTVFGTGKLGLAVCERGIYWRNDSVTRTNRTFLSWDESAISETVSQGKSSKVIKLADGGLFDISVSPFKKAEAIELLCELQTLAKNVTQPHEKLRSLQVEKNSKASSYEQSEIEDQASEVQTTSKPLQALPYDVPLENNNSPVRSTIERIPRSYPIPLSYSYRLIEAEFESLRILKETYRNAEGLTAFLSSLSLSLLDTPTGKTRKQLLNAWRGKGATFGNWYSILSNTTQLLDEGKGPLHSSLKGLFSPDSPSIFAENMSWLINRRDELHHRDLPVGKETDSLIIDARERLERCIQETATLWERNPLRLILDYDAIRNSERVIATCLDYSGDHPAGRKVREEYKGVPKKQDLYTLRGGRDWLSLYPFISVHYCSHCSARETYFVDGWMEGDECASLRSFERAHEETSQEIGKALADLLAPKS